MLSTSLHASVDACAMSTEALILCQCGQTISEGTRSHPVVPLPSRSDCLILRAFVQLPAVPAFLWRPAVPNPSRGKKSPLFSFTAGWCTVVCSLHGIHHALQIPIRALKGRPNEGEGVMKLSLKQRLSCIMHGSGVAKAQAIITPQY